QKRDYLLQRLAEAKASKVKRRDLPAWLEQACAGAAAELEARAEQIARLWRLAQASREG
ncbi:hypothetical protein IGA98_29645, partial [Pseudomonas aeruginosa]|nr:hypothetical protein [Pseudomonas aeruginosa]